VSVLPSRLAAVRAVSPSSYRGKMGSGRHRLNHRAVLRYTHVGCGLDVGTSIQQERDGVRLTIRTGQYQGRPAILRRVEAVRKT
jgi:hypothetical protein